MALLKYLERKRSALPDERACGSTSLMGKDLKLANQAAEQCLRKYSVTSVKPKEKRTKHNDYTPEQRAEIGRYAAENGPTRAAKHFFSVLNTNVPEPTARRQKNEYLIKLKGIRSRCSVKFAYAATRKATDCYMDSTVQGYIKSMREVGGVVTTAIVMAAAEGIVAARDESLLVQHCGHIEITKPWAKSLLLRMKYVKRKCSNAGKVSIPHLKELQENFLADIQAEVVMNEVPEELIFN